MIVLRGKSQVFVLRWQVKFVDSRHHFGISLDPSTQLFVDHTTRFRTAPSIGSVKQVDGCLPDISNVSGANSRPELPVRGTDLNSDQNLVAGTGNDHIPCWRLSREISLHSLSE